MDQRCPLHCQTTDALFFFFVRDHREKEEERGEKKRTRVGDQDTFLDLRVVLEKVFVKLETLDVQQAEDLAVQVEECCQTERHKHHGEEQLKVLSKWCQVDRTHHLFILFLLSDQFFFFFLQRKEEETDDDESGVGVVRHHHKVVGERGSETAEIRSAEEEGVAVTAAVRDEVVVVEETKTEKTGDGAVGDKHNGEEDGDLEDEIGDKGAQEADVQ